MTDWDVPDRDELRALVLRWSIGELKFDEVIEAAEAIEDRLWADVDVGPAFPPTDPRTIAVEVVSLLSMGHVQPLLLEEASRILDLLGTPLGREEEALRSFWEHFDSVESRE